MTRRPAPGVLPLGFHASTSLHSRIPRLSGNDNQSGFSQFYGTEARKSQEAADALVAKTIKDFEPLRKFEKLRDAETAAQRLLTDVLKEATALRTEAQTLLEQARNAAANERLY